jgi:crotonobetainyl-CoA:carnitine CoA-transferase CaiB-like acyl-CoA transferase
VPAGAVRTVGEALHSEETRARGLVTEIPHPTAGKVPNVGSPIRLSDTPLVAPVAAPLLGQHTRHVLKRVLELDDDAIDARRAQGAFGARGAP